MFVRYTAHGCGERAGTVAVALARRRETGRARSFEHLGLPASRKLSAMQVEGYADYVALGPYVNLRAGREALRRDAFEMNVTPSGRYDRYRLLVSYLLDARGMSLERMLTSHLTEPEVAAQLLADPTL